MKKLSIEEQKKFLFKRLKTEPLRKTNENQKDIKAFVQATKGEKISYYLTHNAWDDDCTRNTKVFLVRDQKTKEIVFFFALNCGILFSDLNSWNLSQAEKEPFDKYVDALLKLKEKNLSKADEEYANEQLNESMNKLWEVVNEPDRVSQLFSLAEDKVQLLEEKREALSKTGEEDHIQQVHETFPAIDIKFLGRNKEYKSEIQLDFKLGVYIFWEIIVPHLLEIAEKVGCKYIYLFAADNTEENEDTVDMPPMWTQDYDPYADDDENECAKEEILKLVNYYINELKFRYVSKYKILKPHYERRCYTLVQEVDSLSSNRRSVWQSHAK
ncbi:hypothetical protein [Clostridium sp. AM49-4BH]|uniref:hypothetical protein n=1 Tax=Clostridium sp. AM49-4BH TaxID=2293035 RepID=UPI000E506A1F|nr:hypothetical protein [Clostridium sp. AM49-4BH]RHQ09931.1 hypothetical protein DW981_12450 [Clostridium sp. AM49-4BH]